MPNSNLVWVELNRIFRILREICAVALKIQMETKEGLGIFFHRNRCPVRLISITAARCVAWRCVVTPIVFLFLSPRNATRSPNGNTALQYTFYHVTASLNVDDCVTIMTKQESVANAKVSARQP